MFSPVVTVVLPTYNGSRYLAQSIESVIKQSFQDWELIIVDDCSTDRTPEIIRDYLKRDARIRSIRHDTNRKTPAALNSGFSAMRGRYCTWTSDDNLYRENALQEMVSFLDSNPTVDMVYTDFSIIDEENNVVSIQPALPMEEFLDHCIIGPSFMYRKEVYLAVGDYSEHFFRVEDYDYWLRIYSEHNISPLHKDLYLFRSHVSALTSVTGDYKMWELRDKVLSCNIKKLVSVCNEVKVVNYMRLGLRAVARKDIVSFLKDVGTALKISPALTFKYICKGIAKKCQTAPLV